MNTTLLGEMAALAASVCFTFGPTLFTIAGRQVGSLVTNRMRLLLAALYLFVFHWIRYGIPYPHMETAPMLYMLASGVVGLALADIFLFESFVLIGPRLTLLILNLTPTLATAMAWFILGEHLSLPQLAAIAVVLGGVTWVVLERGEADDTDQRGQRHNPRGLLYALIAATVGAVGTLLAKMGMGYGIDAVSAATVRISAGVTVLWTWTLFSGGLKPTAQALRAHPKAFGIIAVAALIGPVLGISLVLYALKVIPVGIATTLSTLSPILLLPVGYWVFKERITSRAIVGTVIATAGVIWLLTL